MTRSGNAHIQQSCHSTTPYYSPMASSWVCGVRRGVGSRKIGVNATAKRLELKLNVASSGASGVGDPKQLSREAAPGGCHALPARARCVIGANATAKRLAATAARTSSTVSGVSIIIIMHTPTSRVVGADSVPQNRTEFVLLERDKFRSIQPERNLSFSRNTTLRSTHLSSSFGKEYVQS